MLAQQAALKLVVLPVEQQARLARLPLAVPQASLPAALLPQGALLRVPRQMVHVAQGTQAPVRPAVSLLAKLRAVALAQQLLLGPA